MLEMRTNYFLKTLRYTCAFALVLVCLTQCSLGEKKYHSNGKQLLPSPFEEKKVILATDSFGLETNEAITPKTKEGLQLTAIIRNRCVTEKCSDPNARDHLSCLFFNHPNKREKLHIQYYVLDLPRKMTEQEISAWAENDECVLGVSNRRTYKLENFNDPQYDSAQKAYLDTVKFEQASTFFQSQTLSPVRVAIIDTPIAVHPDLQEVSGQQAPGVRLRTDMRLPSTINDPTCAGIVETPENPWNDHGTNVGGIVAATQNNGIGVTGVAHNAQLLGYGVGNCEGEMPVEEIGNSMLNAIIDGAEVVNMSLGGITHDDPALRQAIVTALNVRTVVVVSAGNDFKNLDQEAYYPASYGAQYLGLIPVAWGAVDGELFSIGPNSGSNYSPNFIKIIAPGTSIVTTGTNGSYGGGMGSSFSAPIVTGAVALAIGYMKANYMNYDEAAIEYIVTERGVSSRGSLLNYVRGGNILDFEKLAEALLFLKDTGTSLTPISISQKEMKYDAGKNSSYIEFLSEWNLDATHLDARIGLFDSECGFSAPCLIQDYELEGNSGSKQFKVERNETIPVLPNFSDPALATYITVAIYYPTYHPDGRRKNNFGVDALTRVNLRDFDRSTPSSPFFGKVNGVRTDMQHLYVKGWVCLKDSNKAAPVELIDSLGNPISTDFAYSYPYMVPHGLPIDRYSYSVNGGPFVATGIRVNQTGQTRYNSGIEGDARLVLECNTMTTAHGFEFIVPFSTIKNMNLENKFVRVRAFHPNNNSPLILADEGGNEQFLIPQVNYQPNITSNVSLNRNGENITVSGQVCSESPSPMTVEISFSVYDLACRMRQVNGFPFNDSKLCSLRINESGVPPVFDGEFSDRNTFVKYGMGYQIENNFREVFNLFLTPEELAEHQNNYASRWPNATVGSLGFAIGYAPYTNYIRSKGFRNVASGEIITDYFREFSTLHEMGNLADESYLTYANDRAGTSIKVGSNFWDYMDVGSPMTPSTVAYEFDTELTIGEYISTNYNGVFKVLREVKKYETPLGFQSSILSVEPLSSTGQQSCGFNFNVNKTITQISRRNPGIQSYLAKLLVAGENPISAVALDALIPSMRQVPLDIRFFQDGVMVLHLLSDYGANTYPISTLGRGN